MKTVVVVAVAMAFVMPWSAAFPNFWTVGMASNSENTDDIEIMVESTNSDDNYNTDTTTTLSTLGTIYVDD